MSKDILREKADLYAHAVYKLSAKLPNDELFGLCSQLRRAALSVPLNIVEGYARQSVKSEKQFLTIAYGSLKEAQYLIQFAVIENYLTAEEIRAPFEAGDEIARILWAKQRTLGNKH